MRFEFGTATRILFGPGVCGDLPDLATPLGKRAFLVADSPERSGRLRKGLTDNGVEVIPFEVHSEPDIDVLIMATRICRDSNCDLIIGFGGGSSMDTGKAVAALSSNPGGPPDYLEVFGKGRTFIKPSIPMIAIPTTAGTGSEVTRNAVIAIPAKRVKVSMRSPFLLPRIAVVDPELTYSLPKEITARTGMDALTQLIEPFLCNAASPFTDMLCRDGIAKAGQYLQAAYQDGQNKLAREAMSLVSLYGGMALANARLGAVHGMAGPLGGIYPAPHGGICARLLPLVMDANLQALRQRQPDSDALARYIEIALLLTGDKEATAEDGIAFIRDLCSEMAIPPLNIYGLNRRDFPGLVKHAQNSSSMKGNPLPLNDDELTWILEQAQ